MLCLLFYISFFGYSFSQEAKLDSMKMQLKIVKNDSFKVNLLNSIAFELRYNNPEKAYGYAEEALALAEGIRFSRGQGVSLVILGTSSMNLGKPDRAINEFGKGIIICRRSGNMLDESRAYNNLGNIYSGQGNFSAALKNHLASVKIKKLLGDKRGMANSYNNIGGVLINQGQYNKAISYYNESLKIRKELNDKTGIAQCYSNLGVIYSIQGKYEMALQNQFEALKGYQELNLKNEMFIVYNGIGVSYASQGKYEEALKYYFTGMDMHDHVKDKALLAGNYNCIGAAYDFLGSYPQALEYFLASLKLREETGDQAGISQTVFNIGHIYQKQNKYTEAIKKYSEALAIQKKTGDRNSMAQSYHAMGLTYQLEGNDKAALEEYKKALKIFEEIGDPRQIADTRNSMGIISQDQKDYATALKNHFVAFELSRKINNKTGTARSLLNIANVYVKQRDIGKAKEYLKTGLDVAKETKEKELLMKYYAAMSELDSTQSALGIKSPEEEEGFWKNAYTNFKLSAQYKDSMFFIDSSRLLTEMLTKYETEKKEKEILILQKDQKLHLAEVKRQKLIRNSIITGVAILLLSSLLIFLFYKRKRDAVQKQKETALNLQVSETEMKALRSQMNPHFIFNALQSIQTFLMDHQPDDANTYLLKFSRLMRLVLENSQHSEVPLKEDMQALELYMQLESIRLPHPFTYKINTDSNVDIENDTIPPLILQPFVENAIWHGLQYKSGPGHIDICISKKDNALYATVEDNGIGRKGAEKATTPMLMKKESLGMKLTEERLKILNELKNVQANFKVIDLFTNDNKPAGTKVELSLPLAG